MIWHQMAAHHKLDLACMAEETVHLLRATFTERCSDAVRRVPQQRQLQSWGLQVEVVLHQECSNQQLMFNSMATAPRGPPL